MLSCHFWFAHCSNLKMTLGKNIFEGKLTFLTFPNFYNVLKYYILVTVGSKIVVP